MRAITNDGVIGKRRRFIRCDCCLREIVGTSGSTLNTDVGQVDLCANCVSAGYKIDRSGQIRLTPLPLDAAGSEQSGEQELPATPRRIRIDPQPEFSDGLWYYGTENGFFGSDESMASHLFNDVYGNYAANGVAEAETAGPVLVDGVWYWEIEEAQ
jgi:hypothetical protein